MLLSLLVVSVIARAIGPNFNTFSMLLPFSVFAFVLGIVRPNLFAIAVLEVVLPVAFVTGSVHVDVDSVAVGFVVGPLSIKDIALRVIKFAFPVGFVVPPKAFVLCAIGPDLNPIAPSLLALPLTFVDRAVLELELILVLEVDVGLLHHEHDFPLLELLPSDVASEERLYPHN